MPVPIALIIGVVVIATALIGLVWMLVFLLPFYACVAAIVYFVARNNRREADLLASVKRATDLQREFNEQEMRAWQRSLEEDRRSDRKREDALRRFDNSRGPPK